PVSSASPGNCSAVGEYTDSMGNGQGLLLAETAGTWATGVGATLPADHGSDPDVLLLSVSCTSAGNCSAVGNFTDGLGHKEGLLLTEAEGSWTGVEEATLPPDHRPSGPTSGPDVLVDSVSCASAGECSAVGRYVDNSMPSGHQQGLLLTESGGF